MKKYFCLLMFIVFSPIKPFSQIADNTFIEVAKKTTPCVVFIKTTRDTPLPQSYAPFDFFQDDFFKHFFPEKRFPSPLEIKGSGFFISSDGYITTNYHVIKDAKDITVITKSQKEYTAKIIGHDEKTDLAVIKIDIKNSPYLKFADSTTAEVGQWVLAIGNPFELTQTVTHGIISAKGRENLHITDYEDFLQTDAALNPGNSGGPLVDLKGEVLGICTAIFSNSGGHMGLNFAIPTNIAKPIIDQITQTGTVVRGYVGVSLQEIDKELADAFLLDKPQGILITEVVEGSPADTAGLKQSDILIEYNSIPIKNMSSFRKEIALLPPKTVVTFKVYRDKKYRNVKVILGNYPKESKESLHSIGLEVSQIKNLPPSSSLRQEIKEKRGLVITRVQKGSLADKAGLRIGMIIIQLNHKKITSIEEFQKEIKDKKQLLFFVKYKNIKRFISIRMQ